ncbi:beta-ACP synthase [Dysgonomonas sp. Marseille-P4677]|uniref:beta-ketoacyl synthase N-terminal-like domain-containing protein n=1 Tax=Dysgonomonas sp. Marseille-P4677 TaxID=2364790 RepID=UPI0019142F0C|nr:beta-ketoacyl synthase N-terminal-like domain-containing protein [Dysgonomonas sp. Marseille-P4677]MBK5720096.1 beta-ACP synthase [Dysgonomonas sp. Marseille-P4677]
MGHLKNTYIIADNIISSLGFTTQENIDAIDSYKSGITFTDTGEISDTPILAGLINKNKLSKLIDKYNLEKYTKAEQLIILSIKDLLSKKKITLDECGLIISTTKGNINLLQNHTETIDKNIFIRESASRITKYFEMEDKAMVISNACISGVSALIVARRLLLGRGYKHIIITGIDVLSHFISSGFQSFRSLSENLCKPYDSERDGLNLGEACGSILLSIEEENNSIVLRGGNISNDANHISGPSRTGDGLYYAIKGAMDEAGIKPKDVDYINLHGTATAFNDEMEAKAIHLSKLNDVPINSLKPYFGHTLGASGVIETIICTHELRKNTIYGTLGYQNNGVSLPLNISNKHLGRDKIDTCLKTASGFGGCNAAIVLSKHKNQQESFIEDFRLEQIRNCIIENNTINVNGEVVFNSSSTDFSVFIREAYKNTEDNNQKFYKMDDLCKLGYITALYLLDQISYSPDEIGIILSNYSSSLDTDIRHQRIIDKDGDSAASPATFVYTLPNIVAGEICIRHKIQGENTFFIECPNNLDKQNEYIKLAMTRGKLHLCITGWCEYIDNKYKAEFRLIKKEIWKN